MKKHIIITAALVIAIAGFLVGGIFLMQADRRQETAIAAVQEQLDRLSADATALENALAGLTTAQADGYTAQAEAIRQQTAELQNQLEDLQKEIDNLQAYLDENKDAIDPIMEEVAYLQGVYNELENGLKQVNGYLAEG